MPQYNDIQLRILAPLPGDDAARYPVEAWLNGAGPWRGTSQIDFESLAAMDMDSAAYGKALGKALLNSEVANALTQAGLHAGRACRVRLLLDADASVPHNVRWERMSMPLGSSQVPLAKMDHVGFSRYVSVPMEDPGPAELATFDVLVAVANPSNLPEQQVIDVSHEVEALVEEFEAKGASPRLRLCIMPGVSGLSDDLRKRVAALNWQVADGATSLLEIQRQLERRRCAGLHLLCHGEFRAARGEGELWLETDTEDASAQQVGRAIRVAEGQLRAWVRSELRLVTLQSCRTAAPPRKGDNPLTGIARSLVGMGVPAVVAMQDYVTMRDARTFVAAFYRSLLNDGLVDVATNAGRNAIAAGRGDWSVPTLYSRLRGGQLLAPDLVREAVVAMRRRIAFDGSVPNTMPLKAVDHVYGLDYRAGQEPMGPVRHVDEELSTILAGNQQVFLTGAPGSSKTEQMQRAFCLLADEFLSGNTTFAPVWMQVTDLAEGVGNETESNSPPCQKLLRALCAVGRGERTPSVLRGRALQLIVQVADELAPGQFESAVRAIRRLEQSLAGCRLMLLFNHELLDALRWDQGFAQAKVLVARPLDLPAIRSYLLQSENPSDVELASLIERRAMHDIAGAPWLLSEMQDLHRRGYPFRYRAEVMRLVTERFLAPFGGGSVARVCLERALEAIAWEMQRSRRSTLAPPLLWELLSEVRDGREFRLVDLRDLLIRCRMIAAAGDESVRFNYPALQSYFAARWLDASPDVGEHLEDITATLGRYSRLQHWTDTLLMFAGQLQSIQECERLLEMLVSGASLGEGSQVHLAAQMYSEMRSILGGKPAEELQNSRIVRQIVDTLVWRSKPNVDRFDGSNQVIASESANGRPYQDRRRSLEALIAMAHPNAIDHLISLAFDPVGSVLDDRDFVARPARRRSSTGTRKHQHYDVSGTRLIAADGLLRQAERFLEMPVIHEHPALQVLAPAWQRYLMSGDDHALVELMKGNDHCVAPVAAFAFAFGRWTIPQHHWLMKAQWDKRLNPDLTWGITEMFGRLDPGWVSENVVRPRLQATQEPSTRLCYLIQKAGIAPPGSPERAYLRLCMHEPKVAHRALRAFAKFQDPELAEWLTLLCHAVLREDWDASAAFDLLPDLPKPSAKLTWSLQHAALEALRDVGDLETLTVIRDVRTRLHPVLSLLSFQVAEEIYWRETNGLARDRD